MIIFGQHDSGTLDQFRDVASRAKHAALMADGHFGYVMPIGGVAAYDQQVSPVGVGYDIACGNMAIATDLFADQFPPQDLRQIAGEIHSEISFGVGRKNDTSDAPVNHPLFDDPRWDFIPSEHREKLRDKARAQLGTVGSGNHYVDVFAGKHGRLWIGVHFGSRGFGHTVASGYMALSQDAAWDARVPEQEMLLDLRTSIGHSYWNAMQLAGEYAYAGREWVARKAAKILGSHAEVDMVHNHHNFAWNEEHFGQQLIVIRKGATPAFPGQRGFVGGSMGDNAVILKGSDPYDPKHGDRGFTEIQGKQKLALYSTVHGAGRVMGRMAAKKGQPIVIDGKFTGQRDRSTIISRRMQENWLTDAGVILRGGDVDEAPQAYRRLPDVLAAQGETVEVVETLKPLIVVMAGANEYDPYKD